jgi:predicted nucleotidyltransferase
MERTARDLSAADIQKYVEAARARSAARQKRLAAREALAWDVARRAAALLKEKFGATRAAVFGSLLHPALFHRRSDVDLAVWGLDEKDYYRAVASLLSLSPEIEVDLIEVELARPALQAVIEREGTLL